jgi:hypothetical protein
MEPTATKATSASKAHKAKSVVMTNLTLASQMEKLVMIMMDGNGVIADNEVNPGGNNKVGDYNGGDGGNKQVGDDTDGNDIIDRNEVNKVAMTVPLAMSPTLRMSVLPPLEMRDS